MLRRWVSLIAGVVLLAGCAQPVEAVPAGQVTDPAAPESTEAPEDPRMPESPEQPADPDAPPERMGEDPFLIPGSDASIPDAELDAEQLDELLQSRADSDPGAHQHCRGDQVTLRLGGFDAAVGHRFSQIVARNVSDRPCTLLGTPGIGARGTVGSRLILDLENRDPIDPGPPVAVTLEPGAEAWTNIEWTGALAGRGQEHVRLLVVQLAPDDPPVAFFPPGENGGNPPNKDLPVADRYPWESGGIVDLTAGTTVRIGPWRGEP